MDARGQQDQGPNTVKSKRLRWDNMEMVNIVRQGISL